VEIECIYSSVYRYISDINEQVFFKMSCSESIGLLMKHYAVKITSFMIYFSFEILREVPAEVWIANVM